MTLAPWWSMTRRSRSSRGFTLLELVLVMLIVSTALAVVVPSLSRFRRGMQGRDAVADVLSATRYARARAIQDAMTWRLVVAEDGRSFSFQRLELDAFVDAETDFDHRPVPAWITLAVKDPPGRDYVDFFPSGRSEAAVLALREESGVERQVGSASPAETFRVLKREEMLP